MVAVNHASILDPPLVGLAWPRPIYYLARQSLVKNRLTQWFFEITNSILIHRGQPDIAALRTVTELVEAGNVVLVFPEGTRSRTGRLGAAQSGFGMLAHRSKSWIYPCYIDQAFRAWPPGARWIRPVPITVRFGKPFRPLDLYRRPGGRSTHAAIGERAMEAIRRLIPLVPGASR